MIRSLVCIMCLLYTQTYAAPPKKLVSVGGALTEIIYALDADALLVGSDTTSYYPEAAKDLPKIGYHRQLSAEGVLSLTPDMVLTTDEAGPPAVLKQIEVAGVALHTLKAGRGIEDVKAHITHIGHLLNKEAQAQALLARLNKEEAHLRRQIKQSKQQPRVLFILQHGGGSPMVAGAHTAADGIIRLSGGKNVASQIKGYKPLTAESAVSLNPEVILITTQAAKQLGGAEKIFSLPGMNLTAAAKTKQVIAMDALLLLGFGPRSVEAALSLHQAYQE